MIIFSIVKKAKTAEIIATEEKIPLSSVYKKLSELEKLGLVFPDKIERKYSGREVKLYKSRISEVKMNIKSIEPKIILTSVEE